MKRECICVCVCVWFSVANSTLVPKANAWLQENQYIYLVKCETAGKKLSAVDNEIADQ